MTYKKNALRRDIIKRFGPETGLPLFSGPPVRQESFPVAKGPRMPVAPKHILARLEVAPRAMQLATDTRKLAEATLKTDEMKLADKQQRVYDCILEYGPANNTEIAWYLGWAINRIVGRTFELRQMGLVVPAGKRACTRTGMITQTWRAK